MSDMRVLMEKAGFPFAGQAVGQKPGDQVRGSEPMPKKGGGKKHPYAGRLVGGASESIDHDLTENLLAEYDQYLSEYGAAGSAIGNDVSTTPQEQAQLRQQQVAQKAEAAGQIQGLLAQVGSTRGQIAQLNKSFPTGANPVEKAMQLKDMESQKVQLGRQVEDLMQQIGALRQQAL